MPSPSNGTPRNGYRVLGHVVVRYGNAREMSITCNNISEARTTAKQIFLSLLKSDVILDYGATY